MAPHGRRYAARRRSLVAAVLLPALAVLLALTVALSLAVGGALLTGAAGNDGSAGAPPSDTPSPRPRAALSLAGEIRAAEERAVDAREARVRVAAALASVDEAAAEAGGTVDVVVLGPDGGELLAGPGADRPLHTASLVKLLVVQQLLARAEAGTLDLSPADLGRMERAVTASDDEAMSALWSRFDGPALVVAATTEFGLTGSSPPAVPGQWGEARTTARDTAVFLAGLPDHLTGDDRATLTGWMRATTGTAADGSDQRWGLLSPTVRSSTEVAAKQGWMCCIDGRRQLHSAGTLADGRTVVLLGDFPAGTSWARSQQALDAAATAAVSGT
jgi:hypothetical protein